MGLMWIVLFVLKQDSGILPGGKITEHLCGNERKFVATLLKQTL